LGGEGLASALGILYCQRGIVEKGGEGLRRGQWERWEERGNREKEVEEWMQAMGNTVCIVNLQFFLMNPLDHAQLSYDTFQIISSI